MKEEALAREGFVALTSPEAEWEERSHRTRLLGPFGTHLLCNVDQDAGGRTWECWEMKKQRKSVLSADREERRP